MKTIIIHNGKLFDFDDPQQALDYLANNAVTIVRAEQAIVYNAMAGQGSVSIMPAETTPTTHEIVTQQRGNRPCIAPGCDNMSKGPRYHYLCPKHIAATSRQIKAWKTMAKARTGGEGQASRAEKSQST